VTWFAHVCWFCGFKSRDVNYLINSQPYRYQCKDRVACNRRHASRTGTNR